MVHAIDWGPILYETWVYTRLAEWGLDTFFCDPWKSHGKSGIFSEADAFFWGGRKEKLKQRTRIAEVKQTTSNCQMYPYL